MLRGVPQGAFKMSSLPARLCGSHRLPVLDAHDTSFLNGAYKNYERAVQELIKTAELEKSNSTQRKVIV